MIPESITKCLAHGLSTLPFLKIAMLYLQCLNIKLLLLHSKFSTSNLFVLILPVIMYLIPSDLRLMFLIILVVLKSKLIL